MQYFMSLTLCLFHVTDHALPALYLPAGISGSRAECFRSAVTSSPTCPLFIVILFVVCLFMLFFSVFAFPSSHQVTPDGHAPQVFFLMIKLLRFSEVLLEKDMPKVN